MHQGISPDRHRHAYQRSYLSDLHVQKPSPLPGSRKSKTPLLESAAVEKRMGCHGHQTCLGFTPPLHHDQHLPHQPGSSTVAAAPQQVSPGPHPSSAAITKPQQASDPLLGLCSGPTSTAVCWRIHLSVPL